MLNNVDAGTSATGGTTAQVIIETAQLSDEEKVMACCLSKTAEAAFVKTSTGFGDGPATPEVIDIMVKTVGQTMGVKASGGIRTWETAVAYLDQGCRRLGVASTENVLTGAPNDGQNESY